MEQTDHQNPRSLTQFTRYQFLKKITQLLLSVSLFSFLLSNSSRFSFLHYSSSFSTVPFQLFTHTIDKNCIFLLCNGLLVFVAKFSGLVTSSSSSPKNYYNHNTHIDDQSVKNFDYHSLVVPEEEEQLMTNKEEDVEYVNQEEQNEETNEQDDEEESGNGNLMVVEGEKKSVEAFEKEEYQEKVTHFDDNLPDLDDDQEQEEDGDDDDYEDEDEEENGMLSTEELNKKFDEFIRKMKEEIRIEAQQQLVMVN